MIYAVVTLATLCHGGQVMAHQKIHLLEAGSLEEAGEEGRRLCERLAPPGWARHEPRVLEIRMGLTADPAPAEWPTEIDVEGGGD
ncbi:MAG TPA: hypothetical protein VEI97_09005 [bacterium]|nr:hypothetical protein [bacterium]